MKSSKVAHKLFKQKFLARKKRFNLDFKDEDTVNLPLFDWEHIYDFYLKDKPKHVVLH